MNTKESMWKIGVEPSHWDGLGRVVEPSWETLQAVIGALGFEIDSPEEIPSLEEELAHRRSLSRLAPIYTGEAGRDIWVPLNRGRRIGPGRPRVLVKREGGEETLLSGHPGEEGSEGFSVPGLSAGYYVLELEVDGEREESLLIVAPTRVYQGDESDRKWGFFCPLYALDNPAGFGSGDYSSFREFVTWMAAKGGGLLGTLPLFSTFLDRPFDPSPYAPISRLFWNEFYVDPRLAPNWNECREAKDLYSSEGFQNCLKDLKSLAEVDFFEEMAVRRQLLEILSRDFFNSGGPEHRDRFEDYIRSNGEALEYAEFRADRDCLLSGKIGSPNTVGSEKGRVFQETLNYHLYSQWLAELQIHGLKDHASSLGVDMYLDLPLGVHPEGYDARAYRDNFAEGVSGGAPPDAFFSGGQDWGFRPMHPWKSQENRHRYFRRIIRRLMEVSDLIRLDHVMSLHRLYWVPLGMPADKGAYVRYPFEEFNAIIRLESHLQNCVVVGEDLGTVPQEVRSSMESEGMLRMYVGQFSINRDQAPALDEPAPSMVASINTHDTPTFSGFSRGLDIRDRVELGILPETDAAAEMSAREVLLARLAGELGLEYPGFGREWEDMLPEILRRWILRLSGSGARYLMINLEDLWLEERPQNVPGTNSSQKPNWKLRMKRDFERLRNDSGIESLLAEIDRAR